MIDLALDKTTHDLLISDNDAQLVQDLDQLQQSLKERLQFFLTEWFLDTESGVPFYTDVLIKNPNVPRIDSIIKAKILDTDGVLELIEYDSSFDNSSREYSVTFKARTDFGETDLQVTIFGSN